MDHAPESMELNRRHSYTADGVLEENVPNEQNSGLDRVDGGRTAWLLLFMSFVFEAVLWGFPLSFGVFQLYYSNLPEFRDSRLITYVGTIATGAPYMGSPVMVKLLQRFPLYHRQIIWIGWCLCILGLITGSFADTVPGLIVSQGVLYGVGYTILFLPIVSILNEWWVERRGFAWGVLMASSGVSGVIYPFINEALLQRYGYKTTLRALAVSIAVLTGPLLPLFKRRGQSSGTHGPVKWSFLQEFNFWLYGASIAIQSLGFYLPSLYLPSYAASLGLSSRLGALLLAIMSGTQTVGQITYGYLSDGRLSLNSLLLSICMIAATASLTLWGLAKSITPLIFFAIVYGFFAYAFMAMRVRMGTAVTDDQNAAMTIFCTFSFLQGIGNILAGPLSGALLDPLVDSHEYGYAKYKPLILFTGCSMIACALSITASTVLSKTRLIR